MAAKQYMLSREEAIEETTRMINMVYDNMPREFEIKISAGIDRIPLIEVSFEGIIARTKIGQEI